MILIPETDTLKIWSTNKKKDAEKADNLERI
jgi:hypothetical protein